MKQTRLSMKLLADYMFEWGLDCRADNEDVVVVRDFLKYCDFRVKGRKTKLTSQKNSV